MQYARSLVGRDFRVIVQVALFALYDLVTPPIYSAWVALAALVPLVYTPSIEDHASHTVSHQSFDDHCNAKKGLIAISLGKATEIRHTSASVYSTLDNAVVQQTEVSSADTSARTYSLLRHGCSLLY